MRRIPTKDNNSNEDSRIDHIKCRKDYDHLKLDYKNMVICCPGAINDDFHCDKSKGEQSVTFDIFSDLFIDTLSYKSKDGTIKCSNIIHDKEINNILNLNNALLKRNRLATLDGVITMLNSKNAWTISSIKSQIVNWETKHNQKFNPYNGIVVWYLKEKLKTIS